ncbi:MAG: hypothetical protein D6769_00545 [Methanobacteriota archaeon]|nr:MAG: hypothetical protein D6769_00545 [Euryarchaeota archaeon]
MDEYVKASLTVVSAFLDNYIYTEEFISSIEHMTVDELSEHIMRMGNTKLAHAIINKRYGKVEVYGLLDILDFIKKVSVYLPLEVSTKLTKVFSCYISFVEEKVGLGPEDVGATLINDGKKVLAECMGEVKGEPSFGEFKKLLLAYNERLCKKLKEDDRKVITSLLLLLIGERPSLVRNEKDILVDLVSRKIESTYKFVREVNKTMLEDSVWKGELFVR